MAAAQPAQAQPASEAVRGRMRRQREEELLVWPDLVFIEFISAVVFTVLLLGLSVMVNAVLLDQANPAVTPNPSKAPWYFLNLQELLLHMNPALAGVIVPTIALIALGAIPYWDNDHEGQGEWLATPRAWANVWVGSAVGALGTLLLIFVDDGQHAKWYEYFANKVGVVANIDGKANPLFHAFPVQWLRTTRDFQNFFPLWRHADANAGIAAGPLEWLNEIKLDGLMRTDLLGLPKMGMTISVPEIISQQIIPVTMMIGLPCLLSLFAYKRGLSLTKRDHMILQFSGFIATYVMLTIVGTYFRGEGLLLGPYTIFAEK